MANNTNDIMMKRLDLSVFTENDRQAKQVRNLPLWHHTIERIIYLRVIWLIFQQLLAILKARCVEMSKDTLTTYLISNIIPAAYHPETDDTVRDTLVDMCTSFMTLKRVRLTYLPDERQDEFMRHLSDLWVLFQLF